MAAWALPSFSPCQFRPARPKLIVLICPSTQRATKMLGYRSEWEPECSGLPWKENQSVAYQYTVISRKIIIHVASSVESSAVRLEDKCVRHCSGRNDKLWHNGSQHSIVRTQILIGSLKKTTLDQSYTLRGYILLVPYVNYVYLIFNAHLYHAIRDWVE